MQAAMLCFFYWIYIGKALREDRRKETKVANEQVMCVCVCVLHAILSFSNIILVAFLKLFLN